MTSDLRNGSWVLYRLDLVEANWPVRELITLVEWDGSLVAVLPECVERLLLELPDGAEVANINVEQAPEAGVLKGQEWCRIGPGWWEIDIDYTTPDQQDTLTGLLGPLEDDP